MQFFTDRMADQAGVSCTLTIKTQRNFIVAAQYSNIATDNFMPPIPSVCFAVHLTRPPAFAASLTCSQQHVAVISLCVLAKKTPTNPQAKKIENKQKKNTSPKTPVPPPKPIINSLFSRQGSHSTELLPIWKAAVFLPDILFCPVTVLLQEEKEYICSPCHSTCRRVKKHKRCIRTDSAADQTIPLSSPAASLLLQLILLFILSAPVSH